VDAFIGVYIIRGSAPAGQMLEEINTTIELHAQEAHADAHQSRLLVLVFPCTEGSLKKFKEETNLHSLIVAEWID